MFTWQAEVKINEIEAADPPELQLFAEFWKHLESLQGYRKFADVELKKGKILMFISSDVPRIKTHKEVLVVGNSDLTCDLIILRSILRPTVLSPTAQELAITELVFSSQGYFEHACVCQ